MDRLNRRVMIGGTLGLIATISNRSTVVHAQPGRSGTTETPEAQVPSLDSPTDLGSTGGGRSEAYGINDNGIIVGWSYNVDDDPHGFVWDGVSMQELGTLGGQESEAVGINISGLIVGSTIASDEHRYAVIFDGENIISLGTLGGTSSSATAVNDAGLICGYGRDANDAMRAFVYANGTMTALAVFPAMRGDSRATAINADGLIAGWCTNASGKARPVVWTDGVIRDLAPNSPSEGGAAGINRLGQVAGSVVLPTGGMQAVLWEPDGGRVDLPAEAGFTSEATGINDAGVIIGQLIDANGGSHAVVWRNGEIERLPTLGGPRSTAWAINNVGQIVGSSRTGPDDEDGSTSHAVLWNGFA